MEEDRGSGSPGKKGTGGVREAGEGGGGAGFSRLREAGEFEIGKITQHCATLRYRKRAEAGHNNSIGRESGLKGTGRERFRPPAPPPLTKT